MSKNTKKAQSNRNDRVRLQDDKDCVAYGFINRWTDKEGNPVTNSKGEQIVSLSATYLAKGAAAAGCKDIKDINKGLHEESLVQFINTTVFKIMCSTKEPYKRKTDMILA